jgi:methylmalonyl-CoA/ethylmalonyl-CoA epimerase
VIEVTRFLLVSIVVPNLDEALIRYHDVFGFEHTQRRLIPEMSVEIAILPLDGRGYAIELVAPSNSIPNGAAAKQSATSVADFLERRGPGIHHLTFEIANFDEAIAHLAVQGVTANISEVLGSQGTHPMAIIHPKLCSGVMFELLPHGAFAPKPAAIGSSICRRFLRTSCMSNDLNQTIKTYGDLFGLTAVQPNTATEMTTHSAVFTIGGDDVLESIAPLQAERPTRSHHHNPLAEAGRYKDIDRRKEGPYSLVLEARDLDSAIARFDAQKIHYTSLDIDTGSGLLRTAVVDHRAGLGVRFEMRGFATTPTE